MQEINEIERGQLCQATIESLYRVTGGLSNFPGLLKRIIETKAWERRVSKGKVIELASLRELITEKPIRGWGEDPKKVEAVIRDDPDALAMYRAAMVEKPGKRAKTDISNNVTNKTIADRGNGRAYTIARVQRECDPDTVEAVMAGKVSPNAALVKAGVRENRQIYIPRDPAKAAVKLIDVFGEEFAIGLANELLLKEHVDL